MLLEVNVLIFISLVQYPAGEILEILIYYLLQNSVRLI